MATARRPPDGGLNRPGERCARDHGHDPVPWNDTPTSGSTVTCARCHADVTAHPEPKRNEIDLMGLTLTTTCTPRTNA